MSDLLSDRQRERDLLSDNYSRLPLDSVSVDRSARQRSIIDTRDLELSIASLGVLQPIIVERAESPPYRLIAGERRLEACRKLGLSSIPARFSDELTSRERLIIELEENVKRADLEWQDRVRAVARIHALYCELDPTWTQERTSVAINCDPSLVSYYLKVHSQLDRPEIAQSSKVNEAINKIRRHETRLGAEALEELTELPDKFQPPAPAPVENIICCDFIKFAQQYSGPRFNLLHVDFPYGIEVFSGPQARSGELDSGLYEDTPEIFFMLTETLLRNLDRLLGVSGHVMFWHSTKHIRRILAMLDELAPSLELVPYPLIWHKTDNAGIITDPRRRPRHVYETCLLTSRGSRQIVRSVADVYGCPTDRRFHPSTKPEPMLRHFFTMLVDDTTTLLDPACGSGSSLRAADSLGAKTVLGLELNPDYASVATREFKNARSLRRASSELSRSGLGDL